MTAYFSCLSPVPTIHFIDKETEAWRGSHSQQEQRHLTPDSAPHHCLPFPQPHLCLEAGCRPAGLGSRPVASSLWLQRDRGAGGMGAAGTGGTEQEFPKAGQALPVYGLPRSLGTEHPRGADIHSGKSKLCTQSGVWIPGDGPHFHIPTKGIQRTTLGQVSIMASTQYGTRGRFLGVLEA